MRTEAALGAFFMMLTIAVLVGCRSREIPPGADPFAATPHDFSLSAEVFAPQAAAENDAEPSAAPSAPPIELRAIRFVVFPDGSLHAGSPPAGGLDRLPPFVRRLDHAQYAALWSRLRQLGLVRPEQRESFVGRGDAGVASAPLTYHIEISARGDRWSYTRETQEASPPDPGVAALIRELAELAWVSEALEPAVHIAPRRYDFGGDPYARYRDHADADRPEVESDDSNGS